MQPKYTFMKSNIEVREATLEEALKIGDQIREFNEQYKEGFYLKRIAESKSLILVAEYEGKPAGFLFGHDKYHDGSYYCSRVGVLEEFRGKGLLVALMDYMEQWSLQNGYTKIRLTTKNKRRPMLSYLIKNDYYIWRVRARDPIAESRLDCIKNLSGEFVRRR